MGCATVPYKYGAKYYSEREYKLPEGEEQIVRGKPVKFLDASGWIWIGSLLRKLIIWNKKIDNHKITPETNEVLVQYLEKNKLPNVKVRINQYHPGGEWRRLFKNKAVGAGWRYTLGILSVAFYTILPGRFFGGDNYNPYTNTVNIYSDLPSILLHEGGHAKDFTGRKWKGTHGFFYMIPLVALYYEAIASSDAISYTKAEKDIPLEKESYKVLYPAYATYIGGSIGNFLAGPLTFYVTVLAVIPAHIIGREKAADLQPAPSSPTSR